MKKLFIAAALAALSLGLWAQDGKVLSVTSFNNTSKAKDFDWLNTALTDMLTTDLGAVKKLSVVQRNRLGELLREQEFQTSGIVDEKTAVAAGKIVGADTLVFGDFIISGGKLRINANLVAVQSGKTVGAASATGAADDVFVLEKLLASRVVEALGIALSDAERIELFQMPSRSIAALEQNYRGVQAMDANDLDAARGFFEKATAADPFYRDARRNLEKASLNFSGAELAKLATDDATKREAQLKAALAMRDELNRNLFVFKVNGAPKVLRTDLKANTADVAIDWSVSYNPEVVKHLNAFFAALAAANAGDEEGKFTLLPPGATQPVTYAFQWYAEVRELWMDSSYYGVEGAWIPSFTLGDAAGTLSHEILHGVRCFMSEGDVIGDDAKIQVYDRGGFGQFNDMYRGSVWELPAKLKPAQRMAVLAGIPRAELPKLTQVKVGLAGIRLCAQGAWPYVTF